MAEETCEGMNIGIYSLAHSMRACVIIVLIRRTRKRVTSFLYSSPSFAVSSGHGPPGAHLSSPFPFRLVLG